jgi:hypothetical protein
LNEAMLDNISDLFSTIFFEACMMWLSVLCHSWFRGGSFI